MGRSLLELVAAAQSASVERAGIVVQRCSSEVLAEGVDDDVDVRVEQQPGESLAAALGHARSEIGAYAANFLQIGIMWANHHALFRVIDRCAIPHGRLWPGCGADLALQR